MTDLEMSASGLRPKRDLITLAGESDPAAGATRLDIDLADKLPAPAAAKLRALRDEVEILRAAHMTPYRNLQEQSKLRENILSRIAELQSRERLADDHPLVLKERQNVEILTAKIKSLQAEYVSRSEKTQPLARAVARCERYLEDIRNPSGITLALAAPAPKITRSSDIPTEIEKLRVKITRLIDERESVKNSPLPSADAKKIVAGFVNRLAAHGRPDIFPTLEAGQEPMLSLDERAQLPGMTRAPVDAIGMIAWLFRDKMIEQFNSLIDEENDDASSLSPEDRQTRLVGIDRELLALERTEETLIELAREHLQQIPRRESSDVRALLGIEGPAPRED